MYLQASIGRNVGTKPVEADVWHAFQQDTREALFLSVHDVDIEVAVGIKWEDLQVHTGMGEWDGVKEESAHISVYFDTKPGQINAARLHEHLADRLVALARYYDQDAIAFIVTDSHLATR